MRKSLVALCLAFVSLLSPGGSPARAEEGPPPEQVSLSLARYAELLRAAQRRGGPQATWGRAEVTVNLPGEGGGRFATVTLSAALELVGEGTAEIPLLPTDVNLVSATLDGNNVALLQSGGMYVAVQSGATARSVSLSYLVPLQSGTGGDSALIPLPPVPGTSLTVTNAAAAEVWPQGNVTRSGDTLSGNLPAATAFLVRTGFDSGTSLRRADYVLTLDDAGDGVDVAATFEARLADARGEVRLAPATMALVDVREGTEPVNTRVVEEWHVATLEGRGRHTLRATFRLGVDRGQGEPQVTLHPDNVPITRIEMNVSGKREVTIEPPVPLTLQQTGDGDRARTRVVGHLPPVEEVTLKWTETREAPESAVRTNTETFQLLTLQEGVLRGRVLVRYEVIRGKVKELSLQLPEDVVLFRVTGEGIEDWRTFGKTDTAPRQARIFLGREMEGNLSLELQLEQVVGKDPGTPLTLPLVRPLGAFRESGVVALFDGDKVGFGPVTQTAFTSVGEDALPPDVRQTLKDKVSQAFKHVGEPGTLTTTVVAAQARETRFDARVQALYLVKEGALTGNAAVLVEVKSGRRDKLVVSVPEGVAEPRITAPSLNKVEPLKDFDAGPGRKAYEVRFTQALEGAIQLDVEFEMLLPKDLGNIKLPDVRIHGAEVEEGSIGIAAETGIEVQAGALSDLRRVDIAELPKAVVLRSLRELLLGYQYVHTPWSLELNVKRHQTVETLSATISQAWLETTVLDSGHVVSHMTWRIANEDKQFVRIVLPEGAKVLKVGADNVPVKAVADDNGAIAIPLPKGRESVIDLTYEVTREKLGFVSRVSLVAPQPDLRSSDFQWLVHTPTDLTLLTASTDLKETPSYQWRGPDGSTGGGSGTTDHLFTYAVHDPSEPALSLSLTLASTPGPALGMLLWLIAALGLGYAAWKRGRGRPLGAAGGALVVLGVLVLLFKSAVLRFDVVEALVLAVVVGAAGFLGRRQARKAATAPGTSP